MGELVNDATIINSHGKHFHSNTVQCFKDTMLHISILSFYYVKLKSRPLNSRPTNETGNDTLSNYLVDIAPFKLDPTLTK